MRIKFIFSSKVVLGLLYAQVTLIKVSGLTNMQPVTCVLATRLHTFSLALLNSSPVVIIPHYYSHRLRPSRNG